MPFAKINEINLYYEIHGRGIPLILVEGFGEHHLTWRELIVPLSKNFQVIVFDNRGGGQSEAPETPYSIKMLSKDVVALMEHLNIPNAHFMGCSMGCAIILQLCLDHPELVKKGFLCAPFATLPPVTKVFLQAMMKLLENGVKREILLELQASMLLSNTFLAKEGNFAKFMQECLSDPFPATAPGILGQFDALMKVDLREKLPLIPHELFILVGEQDILAPPFCGKEITDNVGQSSFHILKQMGHFFWYEVPQKVTKYAQNFFLKD